jgi:hypothetical protein
MPSQETAPADTWNGFLRRARSSDVAAMQCFVRLEIDRGGKDQEPAKLAEQTDSRSGEASSAAGDSAS